MTHARLEPSVCPAAIAKPEGGPANGKIYTPDEWNTESTLESSAYRFSKVWKVLQRRLASQLDLLGALICIQACSCMDPSGRIPAALTFIMFSAVPLVAALHSAGNQAPPVLGHRLSTVKSALVVSSCDLCAG